MFRFPKLKSMLFMYINKWYDAKSIQLNVVVRLWISISAACHLIENSKFNKATKTCLSIHVSWLKASLYAKYLFH